MRQQLAILSLLVPPVFPASAATIGNVTGFSTSGPDVTLTIGDGSAVRLSVLAEDMMRVRFAPGGVFTANVSRAVVKTDWTVPAFTLNDTGGSVVITTAGMKIAVGKSPFVLECRDSGGNLIVSDDPVRRMQWDSGRTEVFKTTQPGETYVGLGWRTLGLVRNGSTFRMVNVPNYGSTETFYSGIPFWYGIHDGHTYGLFFDDTSEGMIDTGDTSTAYMSFENLGGQLDYYYFAGPTMADVLDRYTELTGRPYMPPRWSVGYQQCRWSYTPDTQVLGIANEFRSRNIPCDVIYLDIDYMPGGRALTFDSSKFPDPAGMLTTLHGQGFKVVANISPFLFHDDPKYPTAQANSYLIKKADGTVLNGWHDYWYFVGGAGTGSMSWIDFSKTTARNWWAGQHASFINLGIDGIWNDLNEPDELGVSGGWPADVKYNFDGQNVNHNKTSTQYSLLQTDLSYAILQTQYPGRRPFVVSRGGFAGIQRYATLWSGDNVSNWTNDYKRNIPMGLSLSISGQPHNGHDIGGFFGYPGFNDKPSGELYARWMQSGIFSPFCRQHHDGWGNHDPARPFVEPWEFGGAVETICRDFISLRYRLMPYLYTLFYQAHASGAPIQRPTLYDFPDDPNTFTQDYDFMFGPWMLVSPVTQQGATTWNTYLPEGGNWINWWTDTLYAGGQTVNTPAPLAQLPIFVRGGAIIPMAPVSQFEGETPVDELTLELYPVNELSAFTLYEDDGVSWDYQGGEYAQTTYTMQGIGDTFSLDIGARQGTYTPAARHYLLKVHRWPGHTNAPTLNDVNMSERADLATFQAAAEGYYHDVGAGILYVKFDDTGSDLVFSLGGIPVPNVPGDYNNDGDVDLDDHATFQGCLTGQGMVQNDPLCIGTDFDNDLDVDNADATVFLGCLSGAGIIGDPNCAD
jgi:alpha-glucosidase